MRRGRGIDGVDQGEAGGGEHAGLGVEGLAEVLGADEGMVATLLGDDTIDMQTISGEDAADIIGGITKDTLDAILPFSLLSTATLALEEGARSPGRTPKDAGGIGAGSHRVKILIKLSREDLLGFIHGEKQVCSSTDDPGGRITGEELEASLAQAVDITTVRVPYMA